MANTLASPDELTSYPGAPFTDDIVDSAVATLRREAGWHIAPEAEETVTVDGSATTVLLLPTLRIIEVIEVRDVRDSTPRVITGWRPLKKKGGLYRPYGWPDGPDAIEVELRHGFTATPKDLLPVIAEQARHEASDTRVSAEASGGESISWQAGADVSAASRRALASYTVHAGF